MSPRLKEKLKYYLLFFSLFNYQIRIKIKLEKLILDLIPNINVIDVGASYFPHIKWKLFMKSKNTIGMLLTQTKNLGYVDS